MADLNQTGPGIWESLQWRSWNRAWIRATTNPISLSFSIFEWRFFSNRHWPKLTPALPHQVFNSFCPPLPQNQCTIYRFFHAIWSCVTHHGDVSHIMMLHDCLRFASGYFVLKFSPIFLSFWPFRLTFFGLKIGGLPVLGFGQVLCLGKACIIFFPTRLILCNFDFAFGLIFVTSFCFFPTFLWRFQLARRCSLRTGKTTS